jgi:ParB-like chromosome segregation protein Spo0J
MDITKLRPHPWNHKIYSKQDLSELEYSLIIFGQLEPIAITQDNQIISGHRRFAAMSNLGWKEVDVRIIEPTSPLISLVEHNRHRTKTASDILNEAQILKEHIKRLKPRGHNVV